MAKFKIRTLNYFNSLESVQKVAWRISDNFGPTGSDVNLNEVACVTGK